ncbi:MAG TPA: 1-(5-phosphoribosyl)-5-[(5-phosphoribosylamino)methylideneamino]imidazole-4-carboxamide isomerase [Nitrospiria bacterium]|nr:1-(5-phosphoribosyl)-5-[(5-phosphoribosylamino)methylideneamino]imidazole-4-carboxamide isomerase [Nitrospiria bacterium]
MIIIPAIDVKGGKCVRLRQGEMAQETVYSEDPASVALRWEKEGAQRLHLVDLDGAVQGVPSNLGAIESILSRVKVPVQVGGGIRELKTIENYFSAGAAGIILGTSVVMDRSLAESACRVYPGKMIAGIDVREGKVAVRGWTTLVEEPLSDLLQRVGDLGFSAVILTDIGKDGMLQGPNLSFFQEIVPVSPLPVIASGGVTTLEDVRRLSRIAGLHGAIVGKALYAGTLALQEALKTARE